MASGKIGAAPEQAALLWCRIEVELLPGLEAAIRRSLRDQIAAHKALLVEAKAAAKSRAAALAARAAGEPAAMVNEKVEVWRGAKWRTLKVSNHRFDVLTAPPHPPDLYL